MEATTPIILKDELIKELKIKFGFTNRYIRGAVRGVITTGTAKFIKEQYEKLNTIKS
jgi:hypothetical protein